MATGDGLKSTKAYAAAAFGFAAPGVALLIAELKGDGIQGAEWLLALLLCVSFAASAGGTVHAIENKPKQPPAPQF